MRASAELAAGEGQAAAQNNAAGEEEEKKGAEEEKKADEVKSIDQLVAEAVAAQGWLGTMDEFLTHSGKFLKQRAGLCKMLADLEGRGPYEELTDIFGGEREILLAVALQNALHPKNSDRTDAVKADKYVEIETLEQARAFLAELIQINLTNSLRTAESEVVSAFSKMAAASDVRMLVNAPDVFVAAACLA